MWYQARRTLQKASASLEDVPLMHRSAETEDLYGQFSRGSQVPILMDIRDSGIQIISWSDQSWLALTKRFKFSDRHSRWPPCNIMPIKLGAALLERAIIG